MDLTTLPTTTLAMDLTTLPTTTPAMDLTTLLTTTLDTDLTTLPTTTPDSDLIIHPTTTPMITTLGTVQCLPMSSASKKQIRDLIIKNIKDYFVLDTLSYFKENKS